MIALRVGSSSLIRKEAIKLLSQTLKLSPTSANVVVCKYLNSYGCNINIAQQNCTKVLRGGYKVNLRWASVLGNSYAVNGPSLLETEDYRNEHNITISGDDVPDPFQSISQENFPDYILEYLKQQNIEKPTTIQAQGWPIAMSGKNLVGIAQTGTGKTLAYLLPAMIHIKEKTKRKGSSPVVLILAPTRELARQIQQVANGLARMLSIRTACIYGGANRARQAHELENGVDVIIATPGRLIDFLTAKTTNLDRCTYLVLDEADRMLDMGFEPQIRQIADMIPLKRQILMWSATWPQEVQALARDYLGDYVQVNVGSTDLSANHDIKQVVHVCEEDDKNSKLNSLLQEIVTADSGKILIFANMKRTVENVTHRLRLNGWPAVGIHGDKSQLQRDSIIYQYKRGKAKILVASDVAARGLDVDGISHVINYDYPMTSEDYIHRIGRTGRLGATGTSHTLLTQENARQAKDLIAVMREASQEVPEELEELSKQRYSGRESSKQRFNPRNNYNSNWSSRQRFNSTPGWKYNQNRGGGGGGGYRQNQERSSGWRQNRNDKKWDSD